MTMHNKLVRDKIPQIIEESGQKAEYRILSEEEYRVNLEKKLDEEVGEYHRDKAVEELADILEVIYALAATHGCAPEQLLQLRQKKFEERGGFEKGYFLVASE